MNKFNFKEIDFVFLNTKINPEKINKVSVSFSGGKTSGMMAFIMKEWARYNNKEIVFTFANTGLEHEGTYEFVNNCDKAWDLNVKWIEAIVNPEKGKGVRANLVSYGTATRSGEIFENVVRKHGLPSRATPHCTTYLKVYPMQNYLRTIDYKSNYHTAIGIRADEVDRINSNYEKMRLLYPLASLGITKNDVDNFWENQSFNLNIPEHHGNCKTCWKKSDRKLFEIYKKNPIEFSFFDYLDQNYSLTNTFGKGERKMFRGNRSTRDLINDAHKYFKNKLESDEIDLAGSCSESCEVYNEDDQTILNQLELI